MLHLVIYGGIVLHDLTLAFIDTDPFTTNKQGLGFDLFKRLSRTPGLRQKERFCVEVLVTLLNSAPTVRRGFVRKLAEITRWQLPVDLEQCQIRLETERVILGVKRIDLTVEIVRRSENGLERLVVWALEAKVDSGINESLNWDGDEEKRLRNQLDFYSEWLDEFRAEHKAGFVLGKSDLRGKLPSEHRESWRRLTWLGVAEFLKSAGSHLDECNYERVLVESYYAFVCDYIGGVNMMGESEFKIDDVLFLRALSSIGERTVETFDSLVSNLQQCVFDSKVLIHNRELKHQKHLLAMRHRSVLLGPITDDDHPILMVGVHTGLSPKLSVVVETDHRHSKKKCVKRILGSAVVKLNDRSRKMAFEKGTNWPVTEWQFDPDQVAWWDLYADWPLEYFLSASDQTGTVRMLVSDALSVLSESGVVEELRRM